MLLRTSQPGKTGLVPHRPSTSPEECHQLIFTLLLTVLENINVDILINFIMIYMMYMFIYLFNDSQYYDDADGGKQVSTVLGVAIKEEREQNAWSEGVAIWVAVMVVSLVGAPNTLLLRAVLPHVRN